MAGGVTIVGADPDSSVYGRAPSWRIRVAILTEGRITGTVLRRSLAPER
ncbi:MULTISPECIES: hypothetical protein [Actinoplanes]|nr:MULTISPECIES: hypothetical protein [Actinoplanes]